MAGKWLSQQEISMVAEATVEIVREHTGSPIWTDGALRDLIWNRLPELKGRPVWKGIARAEATKKIVKVRYKGFHCLDVPAGSAPAHSPTTVQSDQKARVHQQPPADDGKERYFYRFVAKWFANRGNCVTHFRKGREWGMPDVSIARSLTSHLVDEVELITVEVKRGNATISDLTQAYGYSKLGHRCYLASDDLQKLQRLREQAEKIGIGLLEIRSDLLGKQPIQQCITEVLSPPKSEPDLTSFLSHMEHVFNLVSCLLCSTWFERKAGVTKYVERRKEFPKNPPERLLKFICNSCAGELVIPRALKTWRA